MNQIIPAWEAVMLPNYSTPELQFTHGKGSYLFDSAGKQYLDLISGIAVTSVGHSHPALVAAITEQAAKLIHTSNLFRHEPGLLLAEKLLKLANSGGRVLFTQDGATANEAALKIIRKYGSAISPTKQVVVAFENSFHGRTMGALAVTGNPAKREPFRPFGIEVRFVPVGDYAALTAAFDENVAGVIVEPVQGEGGMVIPPADWLKAIRELSTKHSALMVVDEVQSGMGRSGEWFLSLVQGVRPDVITLAKGLAGGMPLGAVIVEPVACNVFVPGDHGTTFGGNPVSAAAALAVIEIIERDDLLAKSKATAEWFASELRNLSIPGLIDIRYAGLWFGLEFNTNIAQALQSLCIKNGFLVNSVKPNVLRIAPALNTEAADLEGFIRLLPQMVKEVSND